MFYSFTLWGSELLWEIEFLLHLSREQSFSGSCFAEVDDGCFDLFHIITFETSFRHDVDAYDGINFYTRCLE